MAKREVLGLMACPECGHDAAEIKRQKCGVKLYRYCPECNAQFFARTPAQQAAMQARIAPAEAPAVEAKQEPAKAPEKDPEQGNPPKAEPKKPEPKRGTLADVLSMMGA